MIYEVAGSKYTAEEIRTWAIENGLAVSARGRLPQHVVHTFYRNREAKLDSKLPSKPHIRKVIAHKAIKKVGDKVKKPPCPVHRDTMVMSGALGMWECSEPGCKMRAWPKDGNTKPLIGKGKVTLIRERKANNDGKETDTFYLRSDNGVLMDISRVMAGGFDVEYAGGSPIATIELILPLE